MILLPADALAADEEDQHLPTDNALNAAAGSSSSLSSSSSSQSSAPQSVSSTSTSSSAGGFASGNATGESNSEIEPIRVVSLEDLEVVSQLGQGGGGGGASTPSIDLIFPSRASNFSGSSVASQHFTVNPTLLKAMGSFAHGVSVRSLSFELFPRLPSHRGRTPAGEKWMPRPQRYRPSTCLGTAKGDSICTTANAKSARSTFLTPPLQEARAESWREDQLLRRRRRPKR